MKKNIPKKRMSKGKKNKGRENCVTILDEENYFDENINNKQWDIRLVNEDSSLTKDGRRLQEEFRDTIVKVIERYMGRASSYQIEYLLNRSVTMSLNMAYFEAYNKKIREPIKDEEKSE